jgi:2-isopropylmalate synthase
VIRVNSQSGKGGIAYLMETEHSVVMPRRLQVEFSGVVQQHTDAHGGEVTASDIWRLFSTTYLESATPVLYREHHLYEQGEGTQIRQCIRLSVDIAGKPCTLTGEGNGPINATVHALQSAGLNLQVRSYEERSMVPIGEDGNAKACAFMEVTSGASGEHYGVGIDSNIVTASIKALISGLNRAALRQTAEEDQQAA